MNSKRDSELQNGRCPIHPNLDLETIKEENYFSAFRNTRCRFGFVCAPARSCRPRLPLQRNPRVRRGGAPGFSVSRLKSKMPWGVPVPDDDEQVLLSGSMPSSITFPRSAGRKILPRLKILGHHSVAESSQVAGRIICANKARCGRRCSFPPIFHPQNKLQSMDLLHLVAKRCPRLLATSLTRWRSSMSTAQTPCAFSSRGTSIRLKTRIHDGEIQGSL